MAKQILIITESGDITADKVCQWLHSYNTDFVRINSDLTALTVRNIAVTNKQVEILLDYKGREINLEEFGLVWFRRGEITLSQTFIKNAIYKNDALLNFQINEHIEKEAKSLLEFVYKYIEASILQINNPLYYDINKLDCLKKAAQIGLIIPETYVTGEGAQLAHLSSNGPIITKNIQDILICNTENIHIAQSATLVEEGESTEATISFFPSLFQTRVEKIADIRVFFILTKVFAAAIYHYDSRMSIDVREREGSFKKEKAIIPFALPNMIRNKLLKLAGQMNLESGSADFVLTADGEFVFLEINPIGQIDFISVIGNLNLEQEIAKVLIENVQEKIDQPV